MNVLRHLNGRMVFFQTRCVKDCRCKITFMYMFEMEASRNVHLHALALLHWLMLIVCSKIGAFIFDLSNRFTAINFEKERMYISMAKQMRGTITLYNNL